MKSLDEIKRDKERRLQQGSAASQNSTTSKSLSGVTDPGKEWNGKSKLLELCCQTVQKQMMIKSVRKGGWVVLNLSYWLVAR